MGTKMQSFFDKADKIGSLKAKMRLAMITKVTSKSAEGLPDSPDNIKKMEDALMEIKKEF